MKKYPIEEVKKIIIGENKMTIKKPFKNSLITQGFGKDKTSPNLLPFYQSIGLLGHNGFDFTANFKEPVYWDCDTFGKVQNTEIDNKGGLGVNVITEDKDGVFKHRFWHLESFACQAGQILQAGDLIGYADSTGWSTGNHLHRDLKEQIKDSFGSLQNKFPDNGYKGAVDITPYYDNIFILDWVKLKKQLDILQQAVAIAKKLWDLLNRR